MKYDKIFEKRFIFESDNEKQGYICIKRESLYSEEIGYGFVTDKIRQKGEQMQIPEINNGFGEGTQGITCASIRMDCFIDDDGLKHSFCCVDEPDMPLYFRVKVPHSGNYNLHLLLDGYDAQTDVTVFSERRRCVLKNAHVEKGKLIDFTFTANVCDIIPRGKEKVYHDDALDITVIGRSAHLSALTVKEAPDAPTVYIAGDSTVTDQPAESPYIPGESYCGWGQMFPIFFKSGIAVSNHSHSGLTTASFMNDGHWDIVRAAMKPDDYLFLQFGHNDQKDQNLAAYGGYTENLERFVDETRAKGAIPVIVTPVSRSLWNAPGGEFNDLLADWANACRVVAEKKAAPLIDLHAKSVDFILRMGKENAKPYFYPGDYTHHNDFGGYTMASFVVQGVREANIPALHKFLRDLPVPADEMPQNAKVDRAVRPSVARKAWSDVPVPHFTDLENICEKAPIEEIVRRGILRGKDNLFCPNQPISRAEFLTSVFIAFHYLPKNVYNDVYSDIFGDEWYAGTVQSAYDNGFIDSEMTPNHQFQPRIPIVPVDALSILIHILEGKYSTEAKNSDGAQTAENGNRSERILQRAAQLHLVPASCGTLEDSLYRARAALILNRAINAAENEEK